MAVDKNTIKQEIKALMTEMSKTDLEQKDAIERVANRWAEIIQNAIRSADVTNVTTTVTGTAGTFPVTGTGNQNNKGKVV